MELKEAKNLSTSVGMNVAMLSERNGSYNHGPYEILFPTNEDSADTNIQNNYLGGDDEKPTFGSVSTLDWLKTWRSLEIG